jgi:hypothetical protein
MFTNAITDAVARGWANFVARPGGPLNFRFFIQPAIGVIMAVRAGLKDAREGRPAYLWQTFTKPAHRGALVRSGWKDIGTAFLISAILDSVYQVMVHRAIYLLELLFTATLLVIVPYVLLRGPISRLVRLFSRSERVARAGAVDQDASMRRSSETGKSSAPVEKD